MPCRLLRNEVAVNLEFVNGTRCDDVGGAASRMNSDSDDVDRGDVKKTGVVVVQK